MHIKFISRGKGSAKDAETYLTQTHDHKGEVRAGVEVLRGNPSFVSELADSLEFEHRYTSGVVAWHLDDEPTDVQIDKVLDDFDRVAFAGLNENQYSRYAVLHVAANGAKHVHVVAARVELTTGKSMNIAPPNWQKTYDVLVDKYNIKYNWASPKDLHRKKLVNTKINLHSDLPHSKAKIEINRAVMELINQGIIKNEKDVLDYLNTIGEAIRRGKSISLKVEGFKNFRLGEKEGLAYAKGFDVREFRQELRAEQEKRSGATKADRAREYERVSGILENIISDRAKFNRGRYVHKTQQAKTEDERSPTKDNRGRESHAKDFTHQPKGDRERSREFNAEIEQSKDPILDSTSNSSSFSDNRVSNRNVESRSSDQWTYTNTHGFERRGRPSPESQSRLREASSDSQDVQQRDRAREETRYMAEQGRELDSSFRKIKEVDHDAIRKRIKAELEATRRDVFQRAKERIEGIRAEYRTNQDSIRKAVTRSLESDRTAGQDISAISKHIDQLANQYRRSASSELEANASAIDEQVNTFGRIIDGIRAWIGKIGKSIQGVKNELEKLKLFKKASKQVASRKRQTIKRTPWS